MQCSIRLAQGFASGFGCINYLIEHRKPAGIQLWLAAIPLAERYLSSHMQVDKILGKGAPPEFIEEVRELCLRHHCDLEVDVIR